MKCKQLRKYSLYLGNFLVISVTMTHNIQRLSERLQQLLRAFVRFAEQRHRVGLSWIGHSWGGPSSFHNVSITCKWREKKNQTSLHQNGLYLQTLGIQKLKSDEESQYVLIVNPNISLWQSFCNRHQLRSGHLSYLHMCCFNISIYRNFILDNPWSIFLVKVVLMLSVRSVKHCH